MGQQRAKIDIPASVIGPKIARQLVGVLLDGWDLATATDDAQLIVSELVANAVRHAPPADTLELEVVATSEQIRISLADGSSIVPVVAELDTAATAGRGMQLVAALAADWGADLHQGGKRVWVTLAAS